MPFTLGQFLDVFAAFNQAVWPVTLALWIATAVASMAIITGRGSAASILGLAAFHWLWVGIAYHAMFFTRINPAAWVFAVIFVLQAVLLARLARSRPALAWTGGPRLGLAAVFLLYGLAYPAIVIATGHTPPRAPIFGVPCPSTLWTTGVLLALAPPVPARVFVVPLIWSAVGGSAALLFDMSPDFGLLAGGGILIGVLFRRHFRLEPPASATTPSAS